MAGARSEHPHFDILEPCGAGAMGVVYKARDKRLNRIVALKFLSSGGHSEPGAVARFRREAEAIAALNHPAIATIFETGEWDGEPFIALEFLPGGTLAARRSTGPLSLARLESHALQLCAGLEFAHSKGILHRDIKPGNCMFSEHGALKLVDFGLAKQHRDADLTALGAVVGTIAYMAPELLRGEPASERSDLYALGVVVYELAAGRRMFTAPGVGALAEQVLRGSPEPLEHLRPDLPASFIAAVRRATAAQPEHRFASVQEFAASLRREPSHDSTGQITRTVAATPSRQPALRDRANRMAILFAAAVMLVVAGGWAAIRWRATVQPPVQTIVVLPFENLGGDPANQAICDGLQETVASVLSSAPELRDRYLVVPSSEVRRSQIHTVAEARRQFNASLALTGASQRSGNTLQLTLNLSDAVQIRQKDSRILSAAGNETATLQPQLAQSLGSMLGTAPLMPSESDAGGQTTQNSLAYDLYLQGRGALENRNYDAAIVLLKKACDADPKFAVARARLAETYVRKHTGTTDPKWLALADAEVTTAARSGQIPEVLMAQALVRKATGNTSEAIDLFQRLLRSAPSNMDAWRFLAETFDQAGRTKDAEDAFHEALRLHPGYWPVYDALGNFYTAHHRYEEAEQAFQLGIALAADAPTLYYNLGAMYFRNSRWEDAARAFEKSLAVRPTPFGYANLGTVRFFEGQFEEAARQMELATRMQPANAINWGNLGDARWQIPGLRAQARDAFAKAEQLAASQLAINPGSKQLRRNHALYLAKLGRPKEAVAEAGDAIALAPQDADTRFYAARVFAVAGDASAALDALQKAVALGYSAREIDREPDFAALRSDGRYPKGK